MVRGSGKEDKAELGKGWCAKRAMGYALVNLINNPVSKQPNVHRINKGT